MKERELKRVNVQQGCKKQEKSARQLEGAVAGELHKTWPDVSPLSALVLTGEAAEAAGKPTPRQGRVCPQPACRLAGSCALPCSISHSFSASCSKSRITDLAARWWKVSLHRSASLSVWLSRSWKRGRISKATSHCTGSLLLSPFTTALQKVLGECGEPWAALKSKSWGSQSEEVSVSNVKEGCWADSAERGEVDN